MPMAMAGAGGVRGRLGPRGLDVGNRPVWSDGLMGAYHMTKSNQTTESGLCMEQ